VQDLEYATFQGQRRGLEAENAEFRRIASELTARIKTLRKLLQEQATLPDSLDQVRRKSA
jgi:hypothetical protein